LSLELKFYYGTATSLHFVPFLAVTEGGCHCCAERFLRQGKCVIVYTTPGCEETYLCLLLLFVLALFSISIFVPTKNAIDYKKNRTKIVPVGVYDKIKIQNKSTIWECHSKIVELFQHIF